MSISVKKKRILVCPLDWGLGHATRCVPIINELLKHETEVVIVADHGPLAFLKEEFPTLECIKMPGYDISYPKNGNLTMSMLLQSPKIFRKIKWEHTKLDKIIPEYSIDAVISDNRYGLYSNKIPSVLITHQLMLKSPWLEKRIQKVGASLIVKFNECWVPDYADNNNLSGDLSHEYPVATHTKFIGPLSRFDAGNSNHEIKWDIAAIISGPEPQRSVFQEALIKQIANSNCKAILVCGKATECKTSHQEHVEIHSHLSSSELKQVILSSKLVICRPGYSSIMDQVALNKQAVFIPTPGQTEQEYLASYHERKGHFFFMRQANFDLKTALNKYNDYAPPKMVFDKLGLKSTIENFLNGIPA